MLKRGVSLDYHLGNIECCKYFIHVNQYLLQIVWFSFDDNVSSKAIVQIENTQQFIDWNLCTKGSVKCKMEFSIDSENENNDCYGSMYCADQISANLSIGECFREPLM